MATITALPSSLRQKLTAVARRIRVLQAVRGVCFLCFSLAIFGGAALLADLWLTLPALVRLALLAGWVSIGVSVGIFGLIVPLCRRLSPEMLAAVIEEK